MLLDLPEELLEAVVARLDVLDKCSLACTCRELEARAAAKWFREEKPLWMELPIDPEDDENAPVPMSNAWLKRYGLRAKATFTDTNDLEDQLEYFRGTRVISIHWGAEDLGDYGGPPPALPHGGETLAAMFPELRHLDMSMDNGPMTSFEELVKITTLTGLVFSTTTPLTGDPATLTQLTGLEYLCYDAGPSENHRGIPHFLSLMTQLTCLWMLYDNDTPPEPTWTNLAPLGKLEELGLVHFDLPKLPPVLPQLTQLTRLIVKRYEPVDADAPPLFMDPDGADVLDEMPRLACFKMSGYNMTNVPRLPATLTELAVHNGGYPLSKWERMAGLTQLQSLTLEKAVLSDVPASVAGLASLTRLSLSSMAMNTSEPFPPNIRSLRLKDTALRRIPSGLSALTGLKDLFLDQPMVFGGWQNVPSSVTGLVMRPDPNMPQHLQDMNDTSHAWNGTKGDEDYQ